MYKYLKLLMIPMITNSTANLFTTDIANHPSAKNLIIENDLGKIDDLKKQTIENAIKKKFSNDNKVVLAFKFVNINFKKAAVSISWQDLKFPNRKSSKEKLILFHFQPQIIRLSDIITIHDVASFKIMQKYHNFQKYHHFRDQYIMEKLKRKNPLYDNAIWENIKIIRYVNNHKATEKPSYYTNFQAFLGWKPLLETNTEVEYEKLCFDTKWLKIDYVLKRIKLDKNIVKNIQEIEIATPGHILEKFQRLNPDLDVINLKISSNIEIDDNGFGSAIISSHDQNKIIPGYNCYADKFIKINFFTKNKQVPVISNDNLQTIYTVVPNDIVKQFKKQYPLVEIDLKFFTIEEFIDQDDVTAILISPFVDNDYLGSSIYDENDKLKKGFFRQKTKVNKIVCNTDLREIAKLNQYHILERFVQLNPAINPINLEVVDIKISADHLHATATIRNRSSFWSQYQIYHGTVNVTFTIKRMLLEAHDNINNNLKKITTVDSEHILARFIELNPDIDATNLKVSNIEINKNGIGSAFIFSVDQDQRIVYHDVYNDKVIKVIFCVNDEQNYYDSDTDIKIMYYYSAYYILRQFEVEHPECNVYSYLLKIATYDNDISRGMALITLEYPPLYEFIYDDNADYLKPNFFFQEFKLKKTFYNSNLKEIDKRNKSDILERFLKLNPHINRTNLEVVDIKISADNKGTASIRRKNIWDWSDRYLDDIKVSFSMSKAWLSTLYLHKQIRY